MLAAVVCIYHVHLNIEAEYANGWGIPARFLFAFFCLRGYHAVKSSWRIAFCAASKVRAKQPFFHKGIDILLDMRYNNR